MGANTIQICPLFAITPKHALISRPLLPFSLSKSPHFSSKLETQNSKLEATHKASRNDVGFDAAAYEADRFSRDAEARRAMAETSRKETQDESDPKAWKWVIRKRVWDLMEVRDIAQFPKPVHHRIPNFIGAHIAANRVILLIFASKVQIFIFSPFLLFFIFYYLTCK